MKRKEKEELKKILERFQSSLNVMYNFDCKHPSEIYYAFSDNVRDLEDFIKNTNRIKGRKS